MSRACKQIRDKPMSYILDALKRADTERERGAVPGLHARQVLAPGPDSAPGARTRLWLVLAGALVLGVIAAALWGWRSPAEDARVAALEPAPARPQVPTPLVQPVPVPAPIPAPLPASASVLPPAIPIPRAIASAPLKPKSDAVTRSPATQAMPAAAPLLSELSEDIRRQIPALVITGAVYSNNPEQRLLLVNNQPLTQASLAAPEVKLEEIGEKSSVFSFRGTRFRVAH